MKKYFSILIFMTINYIYAQNTKDIILNSPDTTRGLPVMTALLNRASATEFDTTDLSLQDLSDLVWAANGINRKETGKRTAPSALNSQDIDVYVVLKTAAYCYNAEKHILEFIAEGDYRSEVAGSQNKFESAPVFCVLVSDYSKFSRGDDEKKAIWAAEDAGIVSQNIAIFCAGTGLITRPRAVMNTEKLAEILKLNENQHLLLNNPVSYPVMED